MAIDVSCSMCDRRYQVRDEFGGQIVPCKCCGTMMSVPLVVTEFGNGQPISRDPFDDYFDSGYSETMTSSPQPRSRAKRRPKRSPSRGKKSANGTIITISVIGGVMLLLLVGGVIWRLAVKSTDDPRDPRDGFAVNKVDVPSFPDLPAPRIDEDSGVKIHEVNLRNHRSNGDGPGEQMTMRVYLPPGDHAAGSLGCVLVAPEGTNAMVGDNAADEEGRIDLLLPYLQAGYAVIFYSLDGPVSSLETMTDDEFTKAYKKFRAAKGGLVNARNALEFARERLPQVDPDRIFAAGHNTGANVALVFAAHEPRLKGCIAFQPIADIEKWQEKMLNAWDINSVLPGAKDFLKRSSPKTHVDKMHCPVFVFHATSDPEVPISMTTAYVNELKNAGKDVSLVTTPNGDEFGAAFDRGIPAAISWLKRLPGEGGAGHQPDMPNENRNSPEVQNPPVVVKNDPAVPQPPPANSFPPNRRPPNNPVPRIPAPTGNLVAKFEVIQYRGGGGIESAARRIFSQFSTYHLGSIKYDTESRELSVQVIGSFASSGATKSALQRGGFVIGRTSITAGRSQ